MKDLIKKILKEETSDIKPALIKAFYTFMEMKMETPFHLLENDDFDHADPIVDKFMNMGGPKHVVKIFKINSPDDITEAMNHLASTLQETRLALVRKELRKIFASLQSVLDTDNDAVKLERTASKIKTASRGFHQGESLCGVESLLKIANNKEYNTLVDVEKMISAGGYVFLSRAAEIVKNMYESYSTPRNTRVAYTTLATQDGEPYLMCPKGIYINGQAVPMETSKCRENCIDSRKERDGSVSCNYQAWIKQSFQTHDVVMGRLDTTRHPDNEANLLNIEEGKTSSRAKGRSKSRRASPQDRRLHGSKRTRVCRCSATKYCCTSSSPCSSR